jgi:putative phage-type endonuclease
MMTDERGAEWLRERRTYLGATDVVAIMGASPWKTPLAVYLEKTGQIEPEPPNAQMLRGLRMEPYVARIYTYETGEVLRKAAFCRWPEPARFIAASPDYERVRDRRLVEIKTHAPHIANEYGPSGSDVIPLHERLQVVWQMHVTGRTHGADLIALFGVDDVRIYAVEYDANVAREMEEAAREFWAFHIHKGYAPEPTENDGELLERLYPQHMARTIDADDELEEIVARLEAARAARESAEQAEEECIARLKAAMGFAKALRTSRGVFTWRNRKGTPGWKAIAMELNPSEELINRHTPEHGPRVFLMPFKTERRG